MKKVWFFLLVLAINHTVQAQEYGKGNNYVQAGYGFGLGFGSLFNAYQGYSGYRYTGFGPIGVSFERAITDHFGIGASLSYSTYGASWNDYSLYGNNNYTYSYRWNTIAILARGAYHFSVRNEKLDPYVGLGLGFLSMNARWTSTDPDFDQKLYNISLGSPFGYQAIGGLRYMFSDNIGGFVEVGYGLSLANFGLTIKF